MSPYEVRDAIHGLIVLEGEEWGVVDSRPFQRLRGIQQLALTHLVYPGARHSRWEHCVGAAHLAGRIALPLDLDPVRKRLVRLAALSHDIGHGPFSHVSEEVFEQRTNREHVHESISSAIVRRHPEVRQAMGEQTAEQVADLLGGFGDGGRRTVERDIVAGPADVDKLDYLLRDSHYCGVKYGEYDLDKVIESAREIRGGFGEQTFLGFDIDGVFALEEMLLARYHMHRQVYGHRARVATDRMLVRAMELGIEEGHLSGDLFTPPNDPDLDYLTEYIRWDDARVVQMLAGRESPSGEVVQALLDRRLLKRLVEFDFGELVKRFGQPDAGYIAEPEKQILRERLKEAEENVAGAIGVEPYWVSLHWIHLASPISSRFSFRVAGTEILMVDDQGKGHPFDQVSEVFSDTELPSRVRIALYARLPGDASPSGLAVGQRAKIDEALQEALTTIGKASAEA